MTETEQEKTVRPFSGGEKDTLVKEVVVLNGERCVTLDCLLQSCSDEFDFIDRRPALLILPGGGYWFCSAREAEPVAYPFLAAGYQVFILRYSVREFRTWPNPLRDYEQAARLIRSRADEWHLFPDKLAVLGFSGGAHLAACAATMSESERPAAAVIGYGPTLGKTIEPYLRSFVAPAEHVDENTCPCFLFTSRTDPLIPVENTLQFTEALTKAGVSFESHVYAYGPHGFSIANTALRDPNVPYCSRIAHWVNDAVDWLKDMLGDFSGAGFTAPRCPRRVDGNRDPYLSAYCTVNYLLTQGVRDAVGTVLGKAREKFNFYADLDFYRKDEGVFEAMFFDLPLETVANQFSVPKADVKEADEILRQIPNRR